MTRRTKLDERMTRRAKLDERMTRRAGLDERMSKRSQLGMAMFLISEAVFFFLLILAFRYFAPTPHLSSRNGWLLTILLLTSALSMWQGWRWVTIGLGAAFLVAPSLFLGTTFFILAAIHGLHILAGLIALAIVPASALRAMALYWYFFTAVWLVILLVASRA
jgi:heme/copper-type cytochrome/quinol oxidase subunit 3